MARFLNSGTPDFTTVATTDEGIFEAEDDLGTSYYFRGASENNYVKFGKWSADTPDVYIGYLSSTNKEYKEYSTLSACENSTSYNYKCTLISKAGKDMYWRIIRINGDGTVRMIYDGTYAHENGEASADRQVGISAFNNHNYSNAYVGYMYGTYDATTYAETHANINDSVIKSYLEDTWYERTVAGTEYEEYIADAIYCNDRSLYSGTGIGSDYTDYNTYYRIRSNDEPVLTCLNKNDRFTYNAKIGDLLGNDKLKYPVGLITSDEAVMSGGRGTESDANYSYYLYNGHAYWTMSPIVFQYYVYAIVYRIGSSGYLTNYYLYEEVGVRPVISLKADALKYSETSNGTKDYPFTVTGQQ